MHRRRGSLLLSGGSNCYLACALLNSIGIWIDVCPFHHLLYVPRCAIASVGIVLYQSVAPQLLPLVVVSIGCCEMNCRLCRCDESCSTPPLSYRLQSLAPPPLLRSRSRCCGGWSRCRRIRCRCYRCHCCGDYCVRCVVRRHAVVAATCVVASARAPRLLSCSGDGRGDSLP